MEESLKAGKLAKYTTKIKNKTIIEFIENKKDLNDWL